MRMSRQEIASFLAKTNNNEKYNFRNDVTVCDIYDKCSR